MAETPDPATAAPRPLRPRPTQVLPTERVSTPKHFDVLRVMAVISGAARKPVTLQEVENVIKMKVSTLSILTPFYTDIGALVRVDKGFVPSEPVMAFQREFQWNAENATYKLAPLIQPTWFAQRLLPGLGYRPYTEKEAIKELADACSALPEYEPQLRVLLDYMEASGLIVRENELVRLAKDVILELPPERPAPTLDTTTPDKPAQPPPHVPPSVRTPLPSTDGLEFSVSVKVDMAEIAGWEPARITAFFGGIAQVLAAKGALDKGAAAK